MCNIVYNCWWFGAPILIVHYVLQFCQRCRVFIIHCYVCVRLYHKLISSWNISPNNNYFNLQIYINFNWHRNPFTYTAYTTKGNTFIFTMNLWDNGKRKSTYAIHFNKATDVPRQIALSHNYYNPVLPWESGRLSMHFVSKQCGDECIRSIEVRAQHWMIWTTQGQ